MANKDTAHNIFFLHACHEITPKADDSPLDSLENFFLKLFCSLSLFLTIGSRTGLS